VLDHHRTGEAVTFKDGNTALGTATLSGRVAAYTISWPLAQTSPQVRARGELK
jgi:hypothetical protein